MTCGNAANIEKGNGMADLVALREVAAECGQDVGTLHALCGELGLRVRGNWAGRPSLSAEDARALAAEAVRRAEEHPARWRAHLAACEAWQEARKAACRAGADAAEVELRRRAERAVFPGEVNGARSRGYWRGGVEFERRYARPEFNGSRDAVKLLFVSESEEGTAQAPAGREVA